MWAGGYKLNEEECIAILLAYLMGENPPEEVMLKAVRTIILIWLDRRKHARPNV